MKNAFEYEAELAALREELASVKGELEKAYQDLATLRGESLATGDMTHFIKLSPDGFGLVFTADSRRETK